MSKQSRRKALKALAVGAPVTWANPVVESVVLPAHAATTCECQTCLSVDDYYADITAVNTWIEVTAYNLPGCEDFRFSEIWYVQCPPGDDLDVPECNISGCEGDAPFEIARNESCAIYIWKLA